LEKVCVIGANGFLGRKCLFSFQDNFTVVAADIAKTCIPNGVPFELIDITNPESVERVLSRIQPDIVLLTAAMTDVDGCEEQSERAFVINCEGPRNIAKMCCQIGARLIFISTDFVFDGTKSTPYTEDDNPNPISQYGLSKLYGEKAILDEACDALICRTSVLYGLPQVTQRDNFATWLLKRLEGGESTKIVTTQWNTPTFADNFAECLSSLTEFSGFDVFHTVGGTCLSRYSFALDIARAFNFSEDLIDPIESFPQKARRPLNGCLANQKASQFFGLHFATVTDSLETIKSQWYQQEERES